MKIKHLIPLIPIFGLFYVALSFSYNIRVNNKVLDSKDIWGNDMIYLLSLIIQCISGIMLGPILNFILKL